MESVTIRFFGHLQRFLSKGQRQGEVTYVFNDGVVIKHAVEALGIPHTEVELILLNGNPVDFYYRLQEGDRLSIYPPFTLLDTVPIQKLRPPLPNPPRFILDNHLGQLARYLRLLGFDTLYGRDYQDEYLASISFDQDRVLVSRDRRLLMRKQVIYGCCLLSREPKQQLRHVIHRYRLDELIQPWRRCLRCNGSLEAVAKEEIINRLEPKTILYYHRFHICPDCRQVYWKGSHFEPLKQLVKEFEQENEK